MGKTEISWSKGWIWINNPANGNTLQCHVLTALSVMPWELKSPWNQNLQCIIIFNCCNLTHFTFQWGRDKEMDGKKSRQEMPKQRVTWWLWPEPDSTGVIITHSCSMHLDKMSWLLLRNDLSDWNELNSSMCCSAAEELYVLSQMLFESSYIHFLLFAYGEKWHVTTLNGERWIFDAPDEWKHVQKQSHSMRRPILWSNCKPL